MRIMILTLGSRGDVQPFVALGAQLRARGHEVTLTTGRGFEAMIEGQGLIAAPLSDDVRELIERPEMRQALHSFRGKVRAWRHSKGMFRRQLDEMWSRAQEIGPDAIIYHHPKGLAGQHIAEGLGIAAIATALIPAFVPTGTFPSPGLPLHSLGRLGNRLSHKAVVGLISLILRGKIAAWRREVLGLTGKSPRDLFAGYDPQGRTLPRFHPFSRHLVAPPEEWSGRERITGYWFFEETADWQPPEALARFLNAGPPPVYVGFGSMPARDAGRLTQIVLEALEMAGERGLLATGWGGLEARQSSDRVHVLEAAPHDWLFPRCAAVVHHGGAGTTHEGLRWGRPTVICPVFGDQPFWAHRVMEVGAGPAPLPQKRLTAAALAEALATARNPAIVTRATEIGAAMRAEPGAAGAAEAIDALLRGSA